MGYRNPEIRRRRFFWPVERLDIVSDAVSVTPPISVFKKDEMAEILDKMVDADVIVLATPVYFYTMDAQMKTLIDRTVPRYTEIQNKDFYFIVAAADTEQKMMDRTIEGFRGFTQDCLTGAREKGIIYGTGAWQAGEIKGTPAMKQAYEMGRNI